MSVNTLIGFMLFLLSIGFLIGFFISQLTSSQMAASGLIFLGIPMFITSFIAASLLHNTLVIQLYGWLSTALGCAFSIMIFVSTLSFVFFGSDDDEQRGLFFIRCFSAPIFLGTGFWVLTDVVKYY
jgi:hypothetical protein